jgi:hypothetical protein
MTFLLTAASKDSGVCYFGELNDVFYFIYRSGNIKAYTIEDENSDGLFLKFMYETQLTEHLHQLDSLRAKRTSVFTLAITVSIAFTV